MRKIGKLLSRIYKNKWVKFLVIPVILLFLWIGLSLFLSTYASFTTLTKNINSRTIIHEPGGRLLKGESITGEFKATENNLGILTIRFDTYPHINYDDQDVLVFKIKEVGTKTWWYQGNYKSGGIFGLSLYPFGFPRITDSKGKRYFFSITSLRGNNQNAIQLSKHEPIIISKYVFTRSELIGNKIRFVHYLYQKFINAVTDIGFIESSFIYGLPLIFYLLWIGIFGRLQGNGNFFLFIVPLLILLITLMQVDLIDGVFIGILGFWIIIIFALKVESSVSFLFAFIYFIFAFISALFGNQDLVGRISTWTYIFLAIGAVQLAWEIKKPSENHLDYIKLLQSISFKHKKKIM